MSIETFSDSPAAVKTPYLGFGSAQELYESTVRRFAYAIVVPNEQLPEDLRDNRTDGVSLLKLIETAEQEPEIDHAAERARRVELYARQMDAGSEEIEYLDFVADQATKNLEL